MCTHSTEMKKDMEGRGGAGGEREGSCTRRQTQARYKKQKEASRRGITELCRR